ncbi:MAG TPA: hypothetical protein VFN06_03180 [Gaiellaceae bacterium]|nr:hypothetical protein [Gaiellaceae bacterium]
MASMANERTATEEEGVLHRVARRDANRRSSAATSTKADAQSLVELSCECTNVDCERLVKVPLYVYRRMLESDQYLLQAGHHAFPQYRTIISIGLMRIEERI